VHPFAGSAVPEPLMCEAGCSGGSGCCVTGDVHCWQQACGPAGSVFDADDLDMLQLVLHGQTMLP
jgi:hypothetical protein